MSLSSASIAVVDNEEDIVTLFTEVISMNEYIVIGFTNPLFLIDYISDHPDEIKLILIDYKMPQMTGCELADQIYSINPKIRMVLVTAFDDIVNNALNLEVIKKPLPLGRIIEIIEQHMNHLNIV
jgi:DNA-binding NtrC family response regulator